MSQSSAGAEAYSSEYLAEDCSGLLIGTSITFIVLDILFVALRSWCRWASRTKLGLDDYLIWLALPLNLALCGIGIAEVTTAFSGRHIEAVIDKHPDVLSTLFSLVFAAEWPYLTAITLPKLSIAVLYLRIFTGTIERRVTWVVVGLLLANFVAFFVTIGVQCVPLEAAWNFRDTDAKCVDITALCQAVNTPSIVLDVVLLGVPIRTVWKLQLPVMKKLGVLSIFLTGSIGLLASCIRLNTFTAQNVLGDPDQTWLATKLTIWTIVEPSMYLIACCLLSFRPLFSRLTPDSLKKKIDRLAGDRGRVDRKLNTVRSSPPPLADAAGVWARLPAEDDRSTTEIVGGPGTIDEHKTSMDDKERNLSGQDGESSMLIFVQSEWDVECEKRRASEIV